MKHKSMTKVRQLCTGSYLLSKQLPWFLSNCDVPGSNINMPVSGVCFDLNSASVLCYTFCPIHVMAHCGKPS